MLVFLSGPRGWRRTVANGPRGPEVLAFVWVGSVEPTDYVGGSGRRALYSSKSGRAPVGRAPIGAGPAGRARGRFSFGLIRR